MARRVRHAGVRGVGEPAAVGTAAEDPRRAQEQSANEEAPEAERVEARERHVAGAHLQRDEVVREGRAEGHRHQENHGDAVHCVDLVVGLGAEQRPVGAGQLDADEQRFDAADEEEHQPRRAVHDADLLVIDRGHPRAPTAFGSRPCEDAQRGSHLGCAASADRKGLFDDGHQRSLPRWGADGSMMQTHCDITRPRSW